MQRFLEDEFSVEIPVLNAGMGVAMAGPELVAALSEAGGLGVLGTGGLTAPEIEAHILRTRQLTGRPFGANLIIPLFSQGDEVDTVLRLQVPLLVLFWGDPAPYVADAKKAGVCLVAQCGSVDEAVRAAEAGVDAVILQGVEAGGHVKATRPLAENLAGAAKELGSIPILGAGGVATGSDIANALSLGACGVSMGTRFATTTEFQVLELYKQRLVEAKAADTVLTGLFDVMWPDAPHRVLRNRPYRAWEDAGRPPFGERPGEGERVGTIKRDRYLIELTKYTMYPPTLGFEGDFEELPLYGGESCERIDSILPVAVLAQRLKDELRDATR